MAHAARGGKGSARLSRAQLIVLTLIAAVVVIATLIYGVLRLYT